ncbi:Protein of unknown function [Pyronema omphalodes CBS 100304]|uniref:Uncharacterized protein n=1 Tax=Pyronema omphalodes (strain CBS 100304) TaxID=1076935 RepID=U4LGI4_PYROM|nr:Protein of unknown function [Pyronema omphalodes CBS 100304]
MYLDIDPRHSVSGGGFANACTDIGFTSCPSNDCARRVL